MTFGRALAEHLTMTASANMVYIAINYMKEQKNMRKLVTNTYIKSAL